MKIETPSNGSRPGTPAEPVPEQQLPEQPVDGQPAPETPVIEPPVPQPPVAQQPAAGQPVPETPASYPLPEWSTTWPPPGETPTPATPLSEQARVQAQGYDVNPAPAPAPAPQYPPAPEPTPSPAATMPMAAYTPAPAPAPAPAPPPAYTPVYEAPRPEQRNESSGLIWPILLITAGVVLLLNTLGVLSWTVWNGIWRLWPLVLIFIGLELLFGRRSRVASYVIAGLVVLTILGIAMTWSVLPWTGGAVTQQSFSQPLQDATSAEAEISLGVGDLTLGPLSNAGDTLVQGSIALGENEQLRNDLYLRNGVALLTVANTGPNWTWFDAGTGGPRSHTIYLNPNIPMSLKVDGGVGNSNLNLADFDMNRLTVNTGVGKVEVTLPRNGESTASLHGGVGETIVIVPAGTALRARVSQGLGSTNFPSSYTHAGDYYTSPGYDNASNRVNMDISGGVGSVTVREENK